MLDVLQFAHQGLLRRTTRARVPLDRSLIDHDRESKTWMVLRLGHNQLRRLVDGIVRTIPIDDHSIDAPADHIINLTLDLRHVRGTIADVHVL